MDNADVVDILEEIAVFLELKGENPFKTRAYVNGARTIETLATPIAQLVDEERLGELKGFGDALQQKVTELVTTDCKLSTSAPRRVRAVYQAIMIMNVGATKSSQQISDFVVANNGFLGIGDSQQLMLRITVAVRLCGHAITE